MVVKGKLTVYTKVKWYELSLERDQLDKIIIDTFVDQAERLGLRCEM